MKEIQYARWRDYNAEDTVRFYALRLHESGMIKSTPSKIISQGTDWRFFNELKRELKGLTRRNCPRGGFKGGSSCR